MKKLETLSEFSKIQLNKLKSNLELVGKYDIEIHYAIEVIDHLEKMKWSEIQEWRETLITNYFNPPKKIIILHMVILLKKLLQT
jgi:uncharacterized protein with HEPN domain